MTEIKFTEAQQQALDLSRSAAVTAGAGSGKTGVLVERYIRSLESSDGIGVRNILAITFTDKAAAEMKDRVRNELMRRIAAGQNSDRWREVLENLDRASISTIHSFCGSLLREYPVEAGVDPLYETLDETESAKLRGRAVEDALQTAGDRDDELRTHAEVLLRAWGRKNATDNLLMLFNRHTICDAWIDLYTSKSAAELRQLLLQQAEQEFNKRADELFCSERIMQLSDHVCLDPADKLAVVQDAVLELLKEGETDRNYRRRCKLVSAVEKAINLSGGSKKNWEDVAACKFILKTIREQAKEIQNYAWSAADDNSVALLRGLSAIYRLAREIYEEYKGYGLKLDFDDLQARALDLLKKNKGGVREALQRQYQFLLVDEFQDTNAVQWSIVEHVLGALQGEGAGRLFIVGDPKQSIYGFRDADIKVFDDVKSGFISLDGRVEMDDNFRTARQPVDFINKVMSGLMGASGSDIDPLYRRLECTRQDIEGSVSILLAHKEDSSDENEEAEAIVAAEEADLIARQILHFHQQETQIYDKKQETERSVAFGDMALLLGKRTRLALFEEALRAMGIPFVVAGGYGFYERQEVLDTFSLLSFLLHQGDDVALAAVLRSPFASLSDDCLLVVSEAKGDSLYDKLQTADENEARSDAAALHRVRRLLHRWINWARRMPVPELLGHIYEETGMWGASAGGDRGDQTIANLEKLLELARQADDLPDFVENLKQSIEAQSRESEAQVESEEHDAVKILTVHAAKGLEFPVVFVIDTGTAARPNTASQIYIHRDYGFGLTARGEDEESGSTVLRNIIKSRIKKEERAESIRQLYVALTRARDHLVITGAVPANRKFKNKPWLEDILTQCSIDPGDPGSAPDGVTMHVSPTTILIDDPQPPAGLEEYLERYNGAAADLGTDADEAPELLAALPEPEETGRFSPTSLLRYFRCPFAYFLMYELGVPSAGALANELTQRDRVLTDHEAKLIEGVAAHRLFENLAHISPGQERDTIIRFLKEEEVSDAALQAEIAGRIITMVDRFRASDFGKSVLSADEHYSELPFVVRFGRGLISGYIDLLYRDSAGWKILDYKTDNIRRSGVPERAEEHKPQLLMYSIAVGKLLGIEPPEAYVYFARPGIAVPISCDKQELAAFERKTAEAIDMILKGEFAPRPECTEQCEFAHTHYCPMGAEKEEENPLIG